MLKISDKKVRNLPTNLEEDERLAETCLFDKSSKGYRERDMMANA